MKATGGNLNALRIDILFTSAFSAISARCLNLLVTSDDSSIGSVKKD